MSNKRTPAPPYTEEEMQGIRQHGSASASPLPDDPQAEFLRFLAERPALNLTEFAAETPYSYDSFRAWQSGKDTLRHRALTPKAFRAILPAMRKYGYYLNPSKSG